MYAMRNSNSVLLAVIISNYNSSIILLVIIMKFFYLSTYMFLNSQMQHNDSKIGRSLAVPQKVLRF